MRRTVYRLVTVLAAVAMGATMTAGPAIAAPGRGGHPPYPYKECVDTAVKQKKESPRYAKWHCDQLVKRGYIKPPTR
ncbi:hypothetical protein [Streptomyces sp. NPDC049555]|uniref:hypothetical protein n=1 Tax=unclassified Streptomyces TaxID=2593676 RepID=UPI00341CF1CB